MKRIVFTALMTSLIVQAGTLVELNYCLAAEDGRPPCVGGLSSKMYLEGE